MKISDNTTYRFINNNTIKIHKKTIFFSEIQKKKKMQAWIARGGPNGEFASQNKRRVMESHIFGDAPPEPRYQPPPQNYQNYNDADFHDAQPHQQYQNQIPQSNFSQATGKSIYSGNSTNATYIPDSYSSELPPLPDFSLPNMPPPETFDIPKIPSSNPRLSQGKRLTPLKTDGFAKLRDQLERDANEYNSGSKLRTITALKP